MKIRNNTNGKEIAVTKKEWEGFSKMVKAGFKIIESDDSDTLDQVIVKKETRTPPPSGETKTTRGK